MLSQPFGDGEADGGDEGGEEDGEDESLGEFERADYHDGACRGHEEAGGGVSGTCGGHWIGTGGNFRFSPRQRDFNSFQLEGQTNWA